MMAVQVRPPLVWHVLVTLLKLRLQTPQAGGALTAASPTLPAAAMAGDPEVANPPTSSRPTRAIHAQTELRCCADMCSPCTGKGITPERCPSWLYQRRVPVSAAFRGPLRS